MILIYKQIKKRNERKRLGAQRLESQPQGQEELAVINGENTVTEAASEKKELSPEEKTEKKRKRIYRFKIVLGLFGPFCLQSLDTTIIASALPYIATDFSMSFPSCEPGNLLLSLNMD
jgi:hypothetical protein